LKIRLALALAAALVAGALAVPAALALPAGVRVEAAAYTAIGATDVDMPAIGGLVKDTDGNTLTTTFATPLSALDLAAQINGVPWGMTVSAMGAFVDTIDGQTMDPATFADWWQFNVNGYSPSVGASSLQAEAGDSYLFFQNPDTGWPVAKATQALVVDLAPGTALSPGQALTVKVVADDLGKVNSQAAAARFDIVDPAQIQTPAQFAAANGCTIHVGSRAYTPAGGEVTVTGLSAGSYKVWAEKATDATTVWVRSAKTVVNVGAAPVIANAAAKPAVSLSAAGKPAQFRRNRTLTVAFELDKSAEVTLSVRAASGVLLSRTTQKLTGAGIKEMKWNGRTGRKLGASIRITIGAVDDWGRAAAKTVLRVPVAH
jgi:hypothetical protein